MGSQDEIVARAFAIRDREEFEILALDSYRLQYEDNPLYRRFAELLGRTPSRVAGIGDIPFIPVEFFRDHKVLTGPERSGGQVFRSSGTTGARTSAHHVQDLARYDESLLQGFRHFFGDPSGFHILALLPGYLERGDSSLVYMVRRLMEASGREMNGFYIDDFDTLRERLIPLSRGDDPVMLIGVSFALLDFCRTHALDFPGLMVVETGGMKGRGHEPVRQELHQHIMKGFGVQRVLSEYGMTELLSQAWSVGGGLFRSPPWMEVRIRDIHDPFASMPLGKTGAIDIIDLANAGSCSFLSTQDLGRLRGDGSFEILGRYDHSDLRGCNLMVSV